MLRLYKPYISSSRDYGCEAYSSARPTALRMLDPAYNSDIRLSTGAFRSSPVVSFLAESGEPPLSVRRTQLVLNYYIPLNSKPVGPAHRQVFGNTLTDAYHGSLNAPACFAV
jgi:hypothetical protein